MEPKKKLAESQEDDDISPSELYDIEDESLDDFDPDEEDEELSPF